MEGTVDKVFHKEKIPLYQQLYEILHQKILTHELEPGDMLSPESELTRSYGVSRITVRTVLDMLVKEGLIYRRQGKGTFVAHPKLEHGLSRIVNFTEDMLQRGFKPSSHVIFSGLIQANQYIAARLRVDVGEELTRLDRLRLADNEPMCVEKSHFIHRYCPGILNHDYEITSLRMIKERDYGIKWLRATQVIRAINALQDIAKLLSVKRDAPLLYIERTSFSQQDIPIEFLQAYYRADRYSLHNELQGGAG
jgi:GntR family transcriptional regulator